MCVCVNESKSQIWAPAAEAERVVRLHEAFGGIEVAPVVKDLGVNLRACKSADRILGNRVLQANAISVMISISPQCRPAKGHQVQALLLPRALPVYGVEVNGLTQAMGRGLHKQIGYALWKNKGPRSRVAFFVTVPRRSDRSCCECTRQDLDALAAHG